MDEKTTNRRVLLFAVANVVVGVLLWSSADSYFFTSEPDLTGLTNPCADSPTVRNRDEDLTQEIYEECLRDYGEAGWDVQPFLDTLDRRQSLEGMLIFGIIELILVYELLKSVAEVYANRVQ